MTGAKAGLASWLREPLVHFLLGGVILYGFYEWRGEPADPASRTIAMDREEQARVALRFERAMGRPPTDAELDQLIENRIREEIFYREALRLGLDRDDPVLRRRLAQKMEQIASSRVEDEQPGEAALAAWLAQHPERFAAEARYSFEQRWYPRREGASRALAAAADAPPRGERISLPARMEDASAPDVEAAFGRQFLAGLRELETGPAWQGPLQSGLGWHLVRLEEREVPPPPALDEIREAVEEDWRRTTAERRRAEAYRILRDAYSVEVE